MDSMGLLAWLMVGAIAGSLASMIVPYGFGLVGDIMVGILGGLIGGFVFKAISEAAMNGLHDWSIFVSFVGAVVFLYGIRLINGRPGIPV